MDEMESNLKKARPHPSEQVILNKIKSISKANQLRLEEQFRDFDGQLLRISSGRL